MACINSIYFLNKKGLCHKYTFNTYLPTYKKFFFTTGSLCRVSNKDIDESHLDLKKKNKTCRIILNCVECF